MKAIDIIKAMIYDSVLAEASDTWDYGQDERPVEQWITDIFGDFTLKSGKIENGTYLAIWAYHEENLPFLWDKADHEPDAVIERVNPEEYPVIDRQVYLWRIE